MNAISEWFESGKDYYSGVMLLRQYGINTTYFDRYLTAAVPPQYHAQRLADELNGCVNLPIPIASSQPIIVNHQTQNAQAQFDKKEPLLIRELRESAKRWHKLEADNHARLHLAQTKEERCEIAKERMNIIAPALDDIYHQIRVWKETGELPSATDTSNKVSEKAKLNELWREKLSIEPRLSKIKKQEKFRSEIVEKFERLRAIHLELELSFEKNINDYI